MDFDVGVIILKNNEEKLIKTQLSDLRNCFFTIKIDLQRVKSGSP